MADPTQITGSIPAESQESIDARSQQGAQLLQTLQDWFQKAQDANTGPAADNNAQGAFPQTPAQNPQAAITNGYYMYM